MSLRVENISCNNKNNVLKITEHPYINLTTKGDVVSFKGLNYPSLKKRVVDKLYAKFFECKVSVLTKCANIGTIFLENTIEKNIKILEFLTEKKYSIELMEKFEFKIETMLDKLDDLNFFLNAVASRKLATQMREFKVIDVKSKKEALKIAKNVLKDLSGLPESKSMAVNLRSLGTTKNLLEKLIEVGEVEKALAIFEQDCKLYNILGCNKSSYGSKTTNDILLKDMNQVVYEYIVNLCVAEKGQQSTMGKLFNHIRNTSDGRDINEINKHNNLGVLFESFNNKDQEKYGKYLEYLNRILKSMADCLMPSDNLIINKKFLQELNKNTVEYIYDYPINFNEKERAIIAEDLFTTHFNVLKTRLINKYLYIENEIGKARDIKISDSDSVNRAILLPFEERSFPTSASLYKELITENRYEEALNVILKDANELYQLHVNLSTVMMGKENEYLSAIKYKEQSYWNYLFEEHFVTKNSIVKSILMKYRQYQDIDWGKYLDCPEKTDKFTDEAQKSFNLFKNIKEYFQNAVNHRVAYSQRSKYQNIIDDALVEEFPKTNGNSSTKV